VEYTLLIVEVVVVAERAVVLEEGAIEAVAEIAAEKAEAIISLTVLTCQTRTATSRHKNGRP
jgi:hypothetical protein